MRDDTWLGEQLQILLQKYFSSVPITNPIEIKWGREAKYRFGSIKLVSYRSIKRIKSHKGIEGIKGLIRIGETPKKSLITITAMFKDEAVPVGVVHYTIAHELCHYAHGFSSMNRRMFRHPHHGGVINRELRERNAQDLIPIFRKWLKEYRAEILAGRRRV